MRKRHPKKRETSPRLINEDWLAVFLAFLIFLLAGLGLLGPNGLNITF